MNLVNRLLVVCAVSWIFIAGCEGHVESPAFKYSREANEAAQKYTAEGSQPHVESDHHHHHHHGHSHEHHHGHSHHGHHGAEKPQGERISSFQRKETPLDLTTLWTYAIGSTLLISVAPFLILIFIPISERTGHEDFLKTLLSFASGGLLGDAFLHLIPHAMAPHDHHGHSHSDGSHHDHSDGHGHHHDNSVGLCVLMGILAFLMVEKFVRMVKGSHSHGGHGHSHGSPPPADLAAGEKASLTKTSNDSNKSSKKKGESDKQKRDNSLAKQKNDAVAVAVSDIRVAAYLNLAADFAHNFTDGLAIGASFLAGNTAGIVSTVTILLHEVPHEIGDFAILVQSGMSKRKAMCMQLVTAIGCLSGTVVSLVAGGVGAANWVLPFTAGGFIYIATVSVIPELLENTRFWQSVKEIVALILGVSMMMLLTEFEESF